MVDFDKLNKEREGGIDWGKPEHPPTHNFDKAPVVEGEIVSFGTVPGLTDDDGREYTGLYVQVRTAAGIETVWMTTVVKSKIEAANAAIGDYLGIKMLDLVKSKSGKYTYTNFDVRCIHATETGGVAI